MKVSTKERGRRRGAGGGGDDGARGRKGESE